MLNQPPWVQTLWERELARDTPDQNVYFRVLFLNQDHYAEWPELQGCKSVSLRRHENGTITGETQ